MELLTVVVLVRLVQEDQVEIIQGQQAVVGKVDVVVHRRDLMDLLQQIMGDKEEMLQIVSQIDVQVVVVVVPDILVEEEVVMLTPDTMAAAAAAAVPVIRLLELQVSQILQVVVLLLQIHLTHYMHQMQDEEVLVVL